VLLAGKLLLLLLLLLLVVVQERFCAPLLHAAVAPRLQPSLLQSVLQSWLTLDRGWQGELWKKLCSRVGVQGCSVKELLLPCDTLGGSFCVPISFS
jgi:hypothetical protein